MTDPSAIVPVPALEGVTAYKVPRHPAPVDLILDANEGRAPPEELLAKVGEAGPELLRRYPSAVRLEAALALRFGVASDRVIATAGADDGIDRCCRVMLAPGREMVMPLPTFEMLPRYARLTGATVRTVPWPSGPYPIEAVLGQVTDATSLIAMVSPNNPTGAVALPGDLERLSRKAPRALILLDAAYAEFAEEDLTVAALALPNVVVLRTMSKAWGMAGLRVGCALGPQNVLGWMRALGQPYAVSGPSALLAASRLAEDSSGRDYILQVRREREELRLLLAELGTRPEPSQANFVFARTPKAGWLRDGLAGLGISIRVWPGHPELDGCVRITCPGEAGLYGRLASALRATLKPEALLLDMDGPLADVSRSYRQAVIETAGSYGVSVGAEEISRAKAQGNANNDWVLTHRLLAERGIEASIDEVTARFEARYQGTERAPGLWREETLVPGKAVLERLAGRLPLAIVTGRPRHDALRFLRSHGIEGLFKAIVCMEDAPLKPDPAPVRRALGLLGIEHGWMVGDTPDDVRAARAAGVVPIGVPAAGEPMQFAEGLLGHGAAVVIPNLAKLEEMLP